MMSDDDVDTYVRKMGAISDYAEDLHLILL